MQTGSAVVEWHSSEEGRSSLSTRLTPRTAVPAVAVVVMLVAAGLAIARIGGDEKPAVRSSGGVDTAVTPAPQTPAPALVAARPAEPVQSLQDRVAPLVAGPGACLVVMDGKQVVASVNPTSPLVPASAVKLLVARAALRALGREFQFRTRVVARAEPGGGVVDDLWLVGGGDPLLATADYQAHLQQSPRWRELATTPFNALPDAMSKGGLRAVSQIHADATRYADAPFLPSWDPGYAARGDIGPLSALTLNGGYIDWQKRTTPAPDAALYAAAELKRLLEASGVVVSPQDVDLSPAPAGAFTVAELRSAALQNIVKGMLRASDNLAAELIVRELGVHRSSTGTTGAGLRAVLNELRAVGVPLDGVALQDGSGLDRGDRATCAALVAALHDDVTPLLGVSGQSGTMRTRLAKTALAGRVRGKTGWIEGVTSIVGELDAGRPIRFAIIQNGVATMEAGQALEERVLLEIDKALKQ